MARSGDAPAPQADADVEVLLSTDAAPADPAAGPSSDTGLLAQIAPGVAPERPLAPGLRTAQLARLGTSRAAQVTLRGRSDVFEATVAPEVDLEVVQRALTNGDAVLVEVDDVGMLWVVGVLTTRVPEELVLKARRVVVEGEDEVLVRSGTAAMRLREDGDVELVGSRILTMSRGLFRIVGKMLRLN